MKNQLLLAILMLLPLVASAERVEIDGLYYNINLGGDNKTAEVTCQYEDPTGGDQPWSNYFGEIVIPESVTYEGETYSVTSIDNRTFWNCDRLNSVTIPNSVTSIGDYAFSGSCGLTSIIIPNSVTSIGLYGLPNQWYDNQPDGLVYAGKVLYRYKGMMPEGTSLSIEEGTLGIAAYAFEDCFGLTSVTIPASVVSIGRGVFKGCRVTSILVDGNNLYYDSRNNCNAIIETATNTLIAGCNSSVIPNNVTSIGEAAFITCNSLTSVILPDGVTSIGSEAFALCGSLASITIPNSVTSIGSGAFLYCGSLNSVTIPTSMTSIGDGAFSCCGLSSITIPNSVTSIGNGAFQQCGGLTSLTIPSSVTSIGNGAFYQCGGLTSVTIPSSVTFIGIQPFSDCHGLTTIIVEDGNPVYDSRDNCNAIIETKSNTLISSCMGTVIPNSVLSIGKYTFQGRNDLISVTIPNSVTTIDEGAFMGCSFLTSVTIPNNVKSIGNLAFAACINLTSLAIPNSVTSISDDICNGCKNLKSVSISNSVTSIGVGSFSYSGLTSVTIPNSVTVIGINAFKDCSDLTSVTIGKSVTSIGFGAFTACSKLSEVYSYAKNTPQTYSATFAKDYSTESDVVHATLYVPYGSKSKYEQAEGWKNFENIVEMDFVTEPITIGKSDKASYCGDKSLDFSFSDEIKAYIATGFDKDEGTIWLTRVKDVPAGVPVLIKGEADKTYDVPVTESENSYYKNMFVGNTSGEKIQITETDGDRVNYYLSSDGTFKSVNKSANIGNNKCYLQLPGTFEPAVAGATQKVTIKDIGKASYAAPVDLDFTNVEGLKAFTATGYDKSTKTIWLTRVMKVQKGEGVLLKGDAKDYEIPSAAVQSSYMNMFVGNTSGDKVQVQETSADGSQTNFYLNGDGSFVSVNGFVNIGNNKCYLELPTSMVAVASTRGAEANYLLEEPEVIKLPISFRSIGNDGDGTTEIKDQSSKSNVPSDAYYTLQGQRVAKPGMGLYIKNGKKVVIK